MHRYKILFGKYITSHPTDTRRIDGMPEDLVYSADGSGAGNMIDTDINLLKFNHEGMTPKFERIDEDDPRNRRREINPSQPVPPPFVQAPVPVQAAPQSSQTAVLDEPRKSAVPPPSVAHLPPPQNLGEYVARLEKMSVPELTAHAAEEEIDLKGAKTKVDIIKTIRASL